MSIDNALGQSTSTYTTKENWIYKFTKLFYQKSSIRSSVVRSDLTTSTFTQECQDTLYTFSTCRDPKKISVGIVLELHCVGIHVVYNQMSVMCNGIVARRHTYECR